MKNLYYIAIAALLAASAGCSKVEVADAPDKAVTFTVASYSPQTRADNYVSLVGETTTFMSKAYLHAEGMGTTVQDYFGTTGETISANDATNPSAWLPSHDYFWPKSKKSYINFVSWYDKTGTPTTISETALAWTNRTVTPEDNIMWADEAWRYNMNPTSEANNNAYKTADDKPFGKNAVEEGVPTLFHHALAQVRFQGRVTKTSAEDGGKTVNWTVTVNELSLTNVANKGTFSLTNSDPGSNKTQEWTTTNPEWALLEGAVEVKPTIASTPLGTTATDIFGWQSVIPQSTAAVAMKVKFTVKTVYPTKTVEEVVEKTVNLSDFTVNIPVWERNKRYTYTLIIEPDTGIIKIIPVETNWLECATKEITVE